MSPDPKTRQRLLELTYDLLPEREAAELRDRIASEPELAEAHAQARRTAELLAEAARLQAPRIKLPKVPEDTMSVQPESDSTGERPRPAARSNARHAAPWARGANWAVGVTAGVLLLLALGSYWWHRQDLAAIASEQIRLMVTGPARLEAGVANRYTITTTAVTGDAMPSQIEFALYGDGTRLLGHKEMTDESGRLEVTVPADMALPGQVELKVTALGEGKQEQVDTRLQVEPLRHVTQLALDKPLYQPGETIYYRSLTLSRFGLNVDRPITLRFEILDPGVAAVAGSQLEGVTQRGVGNGTFRIPDSAAGGEYTLVAKSPENAFPEERRAFHVSRYRLPRLKKELEFVRDSYAPGDRVVADFAAERAEGPAAAKAKLTVIATVDGQVVHRQDTQASAGGSFQIEFDLPEKIERGDGQLVVVVDDGGTRETIAKTIPINLGKVEVRFYPEGGELVAGHPKDKQRDWLENRVYFTARDPLGEPVHIVGRIVNSRDTAVASVETTHEGMGSFSFRPMPGEKYRLKIQTPAGVADEPKLPEVSDSLEIVLTTGLGVFEPGEPLEFNVQSAKAGLPLVAAAWCRGVPVGQQAFTTVAGPNPVTVNLAERAGGVIRLTIYDYGEAEPRPLAERLVYRRSDRRLKVDVAGGSPRYAPGEKVEVSLRVTDGSGEPVASVLGVSVTDDALLNLADDDTPKMPTHFLLTTEVEKPEDLEKADFYLSDDPKAPVALDLLLGTQGWRRFVERTLQQLKEEGRDDEQIARLIALGGEADPPAVFDNLGQIRAKYEQSLADYRVERTRALNTLTAVSFFGGLGLVVLVGMLALLNIANGLRVWVPALVSAAACLVVGAILMNPDRLKSGPQGAVAFAPFNMAPAEVEESGVDPELAENEALAANGLREKAKGEMKKEMADDVPADMMMPGAAAPPMPAKPAARAMPALGMMAADKKRALQRAAEMPAAEMDADQLRDLRQLNRKADEMGRAGGFGGAGRGGRFRADREEQLARRSFTVRQYAHRHVPGQPGVRSDFTQTLFWNPLLVTDAEGRATIKFDLSDAVTEFRVLVDAHAEEGRIGTGTGEILSRIPFNLQPKLPLEVTAGDLIHLPLAVVNDTEKPLPVELAVEFADLLRLDGQPKRRLELKPQERGREYFALEVTGQKGDCPITFKGTAGRLADAVKRSLRIVPPGFPKNLSYSGQIDGQQELVVDLPEQWVPGSLEVALSAFPSTLADLQQGMEGIMREPTGCFEQASTANYPNVLALEYMRQHDVADPALTRRSKELLKKGYAKLVGYECKKKGYEWFGGDPGHEALTAYGLMEFRDMAKVHDVDEVMLGRTAEWLLERRDGKGGFKRNARALDSFGRAPQEITDAYITWALSESGQKGIEAEVKHVATLAAASDDPYLVALAAASAINAGRKDEGKKLLDRLAKQQQKDGHLEGKAGSITRSGGQSLKVETTALAALAWLKLPEFSAQANRAVEWIIKSRQGSGGFGSTQATILALKSLVAHAKVNRKTVTAGKLIIRRDGTEIGQRPFEAGRQETITIDGLEAKLRSGENKLVIALDGDNKMPYALDVSYQSRKPANDPGVRRAAGDQAG